MVGDEDVPVGDGCAGGHGGQITADVELDVVQGGEGLLGGGGLDPVHVQV